MMANNSFLRDQTADTLACDRGFGKVKHFKKMGSLTLKYREVVVPITSSQRVPFSSNLYPQILWIRLCIPAEKRV